MCENFSARRLVAIFALFLLQQMSLRCHAQKKDIDKIFARPHYSFTIIPLLDQKASISKNIDKYWIHSTIMHGFEAGFTRYSHFDKNHSLLIGIFFGAFSRNLNFHIPGSLFNPPINGDIISNTAASREFNFTGSVPILFEKRWFTGENGFWDIITGITVRYTPPLEDNEEWSYGQTKFLSLQLNYKKKPWLSYDLGGGYSWILRNHNIFKTSLATSLSLTPFIKGSYQFTVPNEPVVGGEYAVKGSYLGLSLSYIFTSANKELLRSYEKAPGANSKMSKNVISRDSTLKPFVFKGNHIQFNFAVLSTFKARLEQTSGNYPVEAHAAPGLLLGMKYQVNFNNHYSIMTGPEITIAGRNADVVFYKNDFSPQLSRDYHFHGRMTYVGDLLVCLPILFEKRFLLKKNKYLFANTGLRLNISTGADGDYFSFFVQDVNNNFHDVAEIDVNANNEAAPWITVPVNAGRAWLLKNNNLMQLTITSNISFTKYVDGTYRVMVPNQPITEGRYSATGSYLGLALNYIFTGANYRIRKSYERNLL